METVGACAAPRRQAGRQACEVAASCAGPQYPQTPSLRYKDGYTPGRGWQPLRRHRGKLRGKLRCSCRRHSHHPLPRQRQLELQRPRLCPRSSSSCASSCVSSVHPRLRAQLPPVKQCILFSMLLQNDDLQPSDCTSSLPSLELLLIFSSRHLLSKAQWQPAADKFSLSDLE